MTIHAGMRRYVSSLPQPGSLERKFRFKENLPFIVRIMAGMDGQIRADSSSDESETEKSTPNKIAKTNIGIGNN